MKVNMTWLNTYLDNQLDLAGEAAQGLAETIERNSVEVDSVSTLAGQQDGLVVAKVESTQGHPDSDHLTIAQLDIGNGQKVQIVTGAPNIATGQLVILAQVGAHIIDRESGDLVEIKAVNLRGQQSAGMVVALQEIGFTNQIAPKDFEAGIYVFDPKSGVQPGDDALEKLGMYEPVIDTDLTPNRADLLSMVGSAYELGAILDFKTTLPSFTLTEQDDVQATDLVGAQIDEDDLLSDYGLRVVTDVQVGDSPLWLQRRLWNAGIRPINNVVDMTNYLMLLYGQPLHAYDLDKLPDQKLTVRLAKEGEKLTTLDQENRDLRPGQDIVIASAGQPLMLAGVMGGTAAEVDGNTQRIVIESARFNPSLIRATARRHNLHSQAASRFERGINPDQIFTVLDHAASLAAELGQGQVAAGQVIGAKTPYQAPEISITTQRINQILGTDLATKTVANIFDRLNLPYQLDQDQFFVKVPGRRTDLRIPADLIEEVARLNGYDNLPATLLTGETTPGQLTHRQRQIRASRHIMESLGLNQAISYALTTPEKASRFAEEDEKGQDLLTLDYPMSSDRTTARQNLLSGLLDDVAYNVARSVTDVALYEQGRVFLNEQPGKQPLELEHLAGVLTGSLQHSTWQDQKNEKVVDFYDLKGIVTTYLTEIGVENVAFHATDRHAAMHPGQTADLYQGNTYLGFIGQIHPRILQEAKLPTVFGFELNLEAIMQVAQGQVDYQPISRFPKITRDLALLVDDQISNQAVEDVITKAAGPYLVDTTVFDVYTGDSLPAGKKSLAYELTYQDRETTLKESTVNEDFDQVIKALEKQLQATVR
ncbi:phenylalanine--tRNA ligase subunit beta [Leuconostocaceae bacterium ESL0723]|nr:phenylalanine--tRNA ligase subunit beta [Leuconostocaceae bacterium ESL0723]